VIFISSAFPSQAESISTSNTYSNTIGTYVSFHQEQDSPLSVSQSLQKFNEGQFSQSNSPVLNFGIANKPVWLAINIANPSTSAIKKQLSFETSWLDAIEIFLITNQQIVDQYKMGDSFPFEERPVNNRFFSINHAFTSGQTTVLVRIESQDPLMLPIYFSDLDQAQARDLQQGYFYGFVYGAVSALLAYNFILFLSLRLRRYLFYSIYLGFFLLTNISYSGHGFQWLWPQSSHWQQWANPILMHAFGISGLLFATSFLNTKKHFPRIYKTVVLISSLFLILLLISLLIASKPLALLSAFALMTSFALFLIILALLALQNGNRAVVFFLIASVTAAITASITAASVWGLLPYTDLSYHAVEYGMVFDTVMLALALAYLFQITEQKKLEAENMARIDPLTSLNNRRAFNEFASIIWKASYRKDNDLSLIMIDLDHFKNINDTFGHKSGDEILIQLSQLLKSENRAGDLLARWGGEEFIILLPDTSEHDAVAISERFRKKISQLSVNIAKENISLTASFGVASKVDINESIDDLITRADNYLYHAKQTGRNRVSSIRDFNANNHNVEFTNI